MQARYPGTRVTSLSHQPVFTRRGCLLFHLWMIVVLYDLGSSTSLGSKWLFSSYQEMGWRSSVHLKGCGGMCACKCTSHACVCLSMCMHVCVHMYVCACGCMCACMLHVYVFMSVCAYVCTCVLYVHKCSGGHECKRNQKKVGIHFSSSPPYSLETESPADPDIFLFVWAPRILLSLPALPATCICGQVQFFTEVLRILPQVLMVTKQTIWAVSLDPENPFEWCFWLDFKFSWIYNTCSCLSPWTRDASELPSSSWN